jgi:Right handed beta helix region
MNSGKKRFGSHPAVSVNNISFTMNRRRFLQSAAAVSAIAGLSGHLFAQASGASEARLLDGREFVSWEKPLTFTKTYYVDNQAPKADDKGPGTKEKPFRTINRAAQILQPGERVVVASGIYRECVRPMRGGTGPDKMISYEAAPGAKVFIRGSEILKEDWRQNPIATGRGSAAATAPPFMAWRHDLNNAMFPDAYNPFALASSMSDREWLDTKANDMGPYFRRRGLIFADGKPLEPVELTRELTSAQLPGIPIQRPAGTPVVLTGMPTRTRTGPIMQEVGGAPEYRFFTDNNGQFIVVRLPGTPANHTIEVATREQAFCPSERGLGYIRVKGLTFQHGGNGYPIPQRGLVSTNGGNHWIIEGNTIEWANGTGLDIANGDWNTPPAPQSGDRQIVRGNTIRYCGVEGLAGMGTEGALIEDNLIEWCGWANVERAWEAAAVKFHRSHNMLFRRNVIRHIRHGNAVWFDTGAVNNRITANVFADVLSVASAVHMEMNLQANLIDNNIIWDVRNAEPGTPGQRGCAGSGLFDNASDKLTIAQNLIGRCDNSGIFTIIREDRAGSGTATGNKIYNNIFTKCGKSAIVFLSEKNEADGNLYTGLPVDFQGFFSDGEKQFVSLAAWREKFGWDKNGTSADLEIDFNSDTLELTLRSSKSLPKIAVHSQITTDFFGKSTSDTRAPGPLADPGAKQVWKVDPRSIVPA